MAALVRCAEPLPANVVIAAGPDESVCWSRKPIHIGESGLMRGAYSKLLLLAIWAGRPRWVNCTLVVWNENRPLNAGDGVLVPLRLLLPLSQARTSLRLATESLRSWKSTSLCSIATLTLKRSL